MRLTAALRAVRSATAALLICAATVLGTAGAAYAEPGDGLNGDPDAAAPYWGKQQFDDCSLMSVADVVGQMTGNKPTEDQIISLATSMPSGQHPGPVYSLPPDLANPDSGDGTYIADLPMLLGHYGVYSVYTNDHLAGDGGLPTGIAALDQELWEGKKVIVSLNGETIWDQPGNRDIHNHALVVTGIDSPSNVVYLNDSAAAGPNTQVSIDTFEAAWRTSDHGIVVAG